MNAPGDGSAVRLSLEELSGLAEAALVANGFSAANAAVIATCVMEAERDGTGSHGLARIPGYIRAAAGGRIDGKARPALVEQTPSHLVVDAGGGFAAPAVALARPAIVGMAARSGMVLASFRASHHLHALWWDVEPLAERGLLALAMVASRPVMAVFGGTARALGTNPIALSAPRAGAPPLTFDMAASAAARGDIEFAARAGRDIPPGWALDSAGHPTRDAHLALAGTQLPFSESPKSAMLALMVELLAVGLSGGRFGFEAVQTAAADGGPLQTGSMIMAFDAEMLGAAHFGARVNDLANHLVAAGASRLPGDRRHRTRGASIRDGVVIERSLVDEIGTLAGLGEDASFSH